MERRGNDLHAPRRACAALKRTCDAFSERSKSLAPSPSPQGRGLEPSSRHEPHAPNSRGEKSQGDGRGRGGARRESSLGHKHEERACAMPLSRAHRGKGCAETQDRAGGLQIFGLTLSQLSYRGCGRNDARPLFDTHLAGIRGARGPSRHPFQPDSVFRLSQFAVVSKSWPPLARGAEDPPPPRHHSPPSRAGGGRCKQMGKVARAVAARRTALTSPCPPRRPASGAWLRRLHCGQPGSVRSATVSAPPLAPLRAPGLSRTRAGRGLLGIGASWCSACDCPAPPGMLGRSQRQWTAAQRRSEAQGDFLQTTYPPRPFAGGPRHITSYHVILDHIRSYQIISYHSIA